MADKMQITIIGMGLIGASAGLALRKYQDKVTIVGHDRNLRLAGQARSMGAVDRTEWNLINAVVKADRIVMAIPAGEIRDTLTAMAQDLKNGCVILDLSDVKTSVLDWAAELLPPHVSLVGGHPIVVTENLDTSGARADLFAGKLFCLMTDARSSDAAVRLATDLIEAMGGKPFFLDPVEHDGMVAATVHAPTLMAAALMEAAITSPGWADMRKLAGTQFYASTLITADDGKAAASACAANREHTVRWLDRLIGELDECRDLLAAGEDEKLADMIERGLEAGRKWLHAQARGDWEEPVMSAAEIPSSGSYLGQMIGMGAFRQRGPQPGGRQPGKPKK